MDENKCQCEVCKNIDKMRWSTIAQCGCYCHESHGAVGHTSLCCAYPNALKKNNPHTEQLKAPEHYRVILDEFEDI